MTDLSAFTVWCAGGRIGTYRDRDKAEAKLRAIASHPLEYLHVQEWVPGESHYPYVTFDDDQEDDNE